MRVFLKWVIIFLIPLLIFISFWEIYLRHINTIYTVKQDQLVNAEDSIQVLFLGNSHEAFDLDPNQFKLYAYNLAQVNQSLYFDKRITLKYLDKLPKLKYVFIGIDYHSLYFSSEEGRNALTYYGFGIAYKNQLSAISKYSRLNGYTLRIAINLFEKDLSKQYKTIEALDAPPGVNLSNPITKGWFSFKGNDDGLTKQQVYTERANEFNDEVKNSDERIDNIADLEDFIIKIKAKNITPIFLTPPCYTPLVQLFDKQLFKQNQFDIAALSQKYQIQYWNYLTLPLDNKYFHDCDHLNDSGAVKFSKILNERLDSL